MFCYALPQEMRDLFFNATNNIAGYHNTCSYGKVAYDTSENFVFDNIVDVRGPRNVVEGWFTVSSRCGP